MEPSSFEKLVNWLLAQREREWVEFKLNNDDPERIGKYISALANSAKLAGEQYGYLVWGIDDATLSISGTAFNPRTAKKGNQPLEFWLTLVTTPKGTLFKFLEGKANNQNIVILRVPAASHHPTRFQGEPYVRIGSAMTELKNYPLLEAKLWSLMDPVEFELQIAKKSVQKHEILGLLNVRGYFRLLREQSLSDPDAIIERFVKENFIARTDDDTFDITNLGAILLAVDLNEFDSSLARKCVRAVVYKGKDKINSVREKTASSGYASGFEALITWILEQVPAKEEFNKLRELKTEYPSIAIRELVANALIHQDFSVRELVQ